MSMVCPGCGCERTRDEIVPDYECPRCGVVFREYLEWAPQQPSRAEGEPPAPAPPPAGLVEGGPEEEPVGERPRLQEQWRLVALVVAVLVVVAAAALTSRPRDVTGRAASWSRFPYDIRGLWEGRAVEAIDLRGREPYEAEYAARFVVDDQFRLVELEWTAGHSLLQRETVLWQWPGTIAYTAQRRSGLSASFLEPPQGEYTQVVWDRGSFFLGTRHDPSSTLPFLETALDLAEEIPRERWSDGGFRTVSGERAIEAVARGGIPKLDGVELDWKETQLELPAGAAALALHPYLQGSRPRPAGSPEDPRAPQAGLALEGLEVVDLPDITCSIAPVEARLGGSFGRAAGEPETGADDWVELMPESWIHLSIARPIGWSARVVFHEGGRAVVRLPDRDLEIPVERTGSAPLAQQTDPGEP